MGIKKIRVRNFMSWRDGEITFSPYITSVTGDSESGKTNLFRAMLLVLRNENWPLDLIHDGQVEGEIEITMSNGRRVWRKRTKTHQYIKLYESDGKVLRELDGVKGMLPFIEQHTGLARVMLDEVTGFEDLNFIRVNQEAVGQGNAESMGRRLANIVGGAQIEDAKGRLQKRSRKLKTKIEVQVEALSKLEASVAFDERFIEESEPLLQQLKGLKQEREDNDRHLQQFADVEHKLFHTMCLTDSDESSLCEIQALRETIVHNIALAEELESEVERWTEVDERFDEVRACIEGRVLELVGCTEIRERLTNEVQAKERHRPTCDVCGRPF